MWLGAGLTNALIDRPQDIAQTTTNKHSKLPATLP